VNSLSGYFLNILKCSDAGPGNRIGDLFGVTRFVGNATRKTMTIYILRALTLILMYYVLLRRSITLDGNCRELSG